MGPIDFPEIPITTNRCCVTSQKSMDLILGFPCLR